jgi:DNA repair exonuclease SbcCD ATPase subunit
MSDTRDAARSSDAIAAWLLKEAGHADVEWEAGAGDLFREAAARISELEATLARVTAERDEWQQRVAELERRDKHLLNQAGRVQFDRAELAEDRAEQAEAEAHALREALAQLRERVTLVVNSMGDVVNLGRFSKAVDPVNLTVAWHTDLCHAIHAALTAGQPREPQP